MKSQRENISDTSPSQTGDQQKVSHGNLEQTSPTDSTADEKVIVNHRVAHAPSFVDENGRRENKINE